LKCTSLGYAPSLSRKLWISLQRPTKEKRSSLLQKFVTYGRKKFL
jgi:hypothetical protein